VVGNKVGTLVGATVGNVVSSHCSSTVIKKSPIICQVSAEKTCHFWSRGGLFKSPAVSIFTRGDTI